MKVCSIRTLQKHGLETQPPGYWPFNCKSMFNIPSLSHWERNTWQWLLPTAVQYVTQRKLDNLPTSFHEATWCVIIPTEPQYKLCRQWWILWSVLWKKMANFPVNLNLLPVIEHVLYILWLWDGCGGGGFLLPPQKLDCLTSLFLLQRQATYPILPTITATVQIQTRT